MKLSRSHPKFIEELFKMESPEVASGVVEIKAIAREAGSRSKLPLLLEMSILTRSDQWLGKGAFELQP